MENALSRRAFLETGISFGSTAAVLPFLNQIQGAQADTVRKAKKIIYLWGCGGGPANPDSFDPKPTSNSVTQLFPSIPTSISGVHFTDQFPELAQLAHEMTLFRARYNNDLNHQTAIASSLRRSKETGFHMLHDIAKKSTGERYVYAEAPNVINAFNYRKDSFSVQHSMEAVWDEEKALYIPPKLAQHDPRINEKWKLRKGLQSRSAYDLQGEGIDRMEEYMDQAVRLIENCQHASVNLPAKDVQRYSGGDNSSITPTTMGPLLARELVRTDIAGAVLVRLGYSSVYGGWDQHSDTQKRTKEMAPAFDHAIAQLIRDKINGLLPDTVIVYDTEFGRTPKMQSTQSGRDHFPWHSSFIVSDDTHAGLVVGSTSNDGHGDQDQYTNQDFTGVVLETTNEEPNFARRVKHKGLFKSIPS